MRRLLLLLLLALLPLAALAQPAPGTFEATVTASDGSTETLSGTALVSAYPASLGGHWSVLLDDGTQILGLQRSSEPGPSGADFGDAREPAADEAVRAYVRLGGPSMGTFSTGTTPPDSDNRLSITEVSGLGTIGTFDFAAATVMTNGSEEPVRITGSFHALESLASDGGSDGGGTDGGGSDGGGTDGGGTDGGGTDGDFPVPPASDDCYAQWQGIADMLQGVTAWAGFAGGTNVGGAGTFTSVSSGGMSMWQVILMNGCNPAFNNPAAHSLNLSQLTTPQVGVYRILNAYEQRPPTPLEAVGGAVAYGRAYYFTSGYLWINSIGTDGRIRGTYAGYIKPLEIPNLPTPPSFSIEGRFDTGPEGAMPGLPPGMTMPPTGGGN